MEKVEKDKKRYQNGKIYSIRSHQTVDVYIGSTINSLAKRLDGHKKGFKCWNNNKKGNFVTSYDIIKFNDCYIELIENYPCNNKNELDRQEGIHIRNTDCVNKIIAGRTQKEYCIDMRDVILKGKREHYIKHRDEQILKSKQNYVKRRDEILKRMNEYNIKNRDAINQKAKARYIKNKELISQQAKARYQAKKLAQLNNQPIN